MDGDPPALIIGSRLVCSQENCLFSVSRHTICQVDGFTVGNLLRQ